MPTKHNDTFLKALIEATDYGILMTDLSGTDLLSNRRFLEIFGMDPDSVGKLPRDEMRKQALARVKDPEEFTTCIERVYADPTMEMEDEVETVAPTNKILRRHTAPVRHTSGEIVGRIWTFLDITETKRLQAEVASYTRRLEQRLAEQAAELRAAQDRLLETARMRAVGTLATGIAHELRNILTGLRLEIADTESRGGPVSMRQLDRLYALSHSLLALSQEEQPFCGPVDMGDIIGFVFQLVRGQADIDGVTLSVQVQDSVPPAYGNPRRLEHLFINLVLNGLNAMSSYGGSLTACISRDADRVRVELQDTGHGIPAKFQSRLFEPFFTTRANKTGLGLFSARRIIDEHSGEIEINSTDGHGACVTVWLPLAEQQPEQEDEELESME